VPPPSPAGSPSSWSSPPPGGDAVDTAVLPVARSIDRYRPKPRRHTRDHSLRRTGAAPLQTKIVTSPPISRPTTSTTPVGGHCSIAGSRKGRKKGLGREPHVRERHTVRRRPGPRCSGRTRRRADSVEFVRFDAVDPAEIARGRRRKHDRFLRALESVSILAPTEAWGGSSWGVDPRTLGSRGCPDSVSHGLRTVTSHGLRPRTFARASYGGGRQWPEPRDESAGGSRNVNWRVSAKCLPTST
jgi:hypothetical protein